MSPWRRAAGSFLSVVLLACAVFPLFKEDALCVFNTGKGWEYYVVPALVCLTLLLSPSIKWLKVGPLGAEFNPIPEYYKKEFEPLPSTFTPEKD